MVLEISHATLAYSILENKFSRTWTSEDEDMDLKIGPRGSSRTRTFLEDNNTIFTNAPLAAAEGRRNIIVKFERPSNILRLISVCCSFSFYHACMLFEMYVSYKSYSSCGHVLSWQFFVCAKKFHYVR